MRQVSFGLTNDIRRFAEHCWQIMEQEPAD